MTRRALRLGAAVVFCVGTTLFVCVFSGVVVIAASAIQRLAIQVQQAFDTAQLPQRFDDTLQALQHPFRPQRSKR